ncbi:septum formation initiator family protein [Acetohalobium arabaticum]|uniref:Septum formation initiator n=1 Tax=Acetohalobium arabaticum (strain ATCC 49924 / DSM 5501 / Z-7288) TaxID=574087 RepID=D9QVM0_ACEAZ|nr:septum formation initiator family protein [Acetohalobium arabaticum]ADL12279.1 Septum formation initiator [Acetohalobium arabaticum DSM 5501]
MNKVIVVEKKTKDYKKINSTASNKEKQQRQQKSSNNNKSDSILIYMIIGILITLITVIFSILYINKYVELSKINLKINQVEKEIETLTAKKQKLKLKISQNKSLSRVEKVAKNELGMIKAEDIEYIAMGQQEMSNIKNKPSVDSTVNRFRLSRLSRKVISWLQGLTEVEAGTLEE